MPFVRNATEVEYKRHLREMLRTDKSSGSNVVDLSLFCLPHSFSSYNLVREVDT